MTPARALTALLVVQSISSTPVVRRDEDAWEEDAHLFLQQRAEETAFPWIPKCSVDTAPSIYVSPEGKDEALCEDTSDDCSKSWVPQRCADGVASWLAKCPMTCKTCDPTTQKVAPGKWGAPYQTLQYAVDNRLAHAKEATGSCITINLMKGTYRNADFGKSGGGEEYILNLNGLSDVIIKNVNKHTVQLEFDGPGGFRGGSTSAPVTDVEFYGFTISGPNQLITYEEAIADRSKGLNGNRRFTGQGISIWAGHRIWMHDLKVHDTPAAGLRVNNADYLVVENCEVFRTTWWSRTAESAIVFAQSKNIDDETKTKMIMRNNKVYENMNKIPYYNPSYAYDYFPIGKDKCKDDVLPACKTLYQCCGPQDQSCCDDTAKKYACPWQCRYGKLSQDYVIDGQGVYVTRNSDTYLKGAMELSGNVAYNNGINGLVFHRTHNGMVKGNIIFDNGQLPSDKHEEKFTCNQPDDDGCWKIPLSKAQNPDKPKTGRQPYSGLTLSNSENVKLWSNVVKARYSDDKSYEFEIDAGEDYSVKAGGNNKNCLGKVTSKIAKFVADVTEGSTRYTTTCAQGVLDANKAHAQ